jgi:TonB family protein
MGGTSVASPGSARMDRLTIGPQVANLPHVVRLRVYGGMMHRYAVLFALVSTALCGQDALHEGIAAFRNAHYQEAIECFQREVATHPNSVEGHLYLGTAFIRLWIPGAAAQENEAYARSAEMEFRRVLELDPTEKTALASLASLAFNEAGPLPLEEKMRKLDEARDWNTRLTVVDPTNKEAYYTLGVIAWAKWYPALMTARARQGLKPEDPGPMASPGREEMKAEYSSMVEEGIANLNHALLLDPDYDDAMAYLNLLIRERADLLDTKEEYAADIASADEWVQKVLDTKRAKGQADVPVPMRVKPVSTVEPLYPPLARVARIEGMVRFRVGIARDGSIQSVQLVSGHPLLVNAARDAVMQYVFNPVVVNGNAVEAVTQVHVRFALGN